MPWRALFWVLAVLVAVPRAWAEDLAHVIRPGDTPVSLAKTYHVSVAAILAHNTGCDPRRLRVGDVLRVPRADAPAPSSPAGPGPAAKAAAAPAGVLPDEEAPGGRHVVAPGDTPSGIAARYGIGLTDLDRANPGLDSKNLPVGKVLVIPSPNPAAPPPVTVTRSGQPEGRTAPLDMDFR
jgi:LysM repeat protein